MNLSHSGKDLIESGAPEECVKALGVVNEKKAEFAELVKSRENVSNDCKHFEVNPPALAQVETHIAQLQEDINAQETMWNLFEEFNTELEKFRKEDWISFRARYFSFEEFLLKWYEKLRKSEQMNVMTLRLIKDIEKYKVCFCSVSYTNFTPL